MTTTRSYAHVGCATVLLGGASLVFAGGGFEAIQQGHPLGWLAVAGAIGLLLLLGFLYWISYRAYQRRDWIERQPYSHFAQQGLKRGGFWKGFLVAWSVVLVVHVVALFGMGFAPALPYPEQTGAIFSLAVLVLVPAHVVVPILGGAVYSLTRSTSIPDQ
ncbi:hypothetical protein FB548_2248 [Pseudoxanthomonas sp. 3HH-4]|uniref:hypothetical protein n=1 Tax=Pseudoxanthomonas sp. 3HH-4 TaxID=1690214 RepID=UPI001152B122|nr:hypothetical protein [Pseudoxanthomonas sp. 3HH-4]TQM12315.1 hypothetical protein FB548_2248 [Pseudoxanthomonas sp. 3HH-4]